MVCCCYFHCVMLGHKWRGSAAVQGLWACLRLHSPSVSHPGGLSHTHTPPPRRLCHSPGPRRHDAWQEADSRPALLSQGIAMLRGFGKLAVLFLALPMAQPNLQARLPWVAVRVSGGRRAGSRGAAGTDTSTRLTGEMCSRCNSCQEENIQFPWRDDRSGPIGWAVHNHEPWLRRTDRTARKLKSSVQVPVGSVCNWQSLQHLPLQ